MYNIICFTSWSNWFVKHPPTAHFSLVESISVQLQYSLASKGLSSCRSYEICTQMKPQYYVKTDHFLVQLTSKGITTNYGPVFLVFYSSGSRALFHEQSATLGARLHTAVASGDSQGQPGAGRWGQGGVRGAMTGWSLVEWGIRDWRDGQ